MQSLIMSMSVWISAQSFSGTFWQILSALDKGLGSLTGNCRSQPSVKSNAERIAVLVTVLTVVFLAPRRGSCSLKTRKETCKEKSPRNWRQQGRRCVPWGSLHLGQCVPNVKSLSAGSATCCTPRAALLLTAYWTTMIREGTPPAVLMLDFPKTTTCACTQSRLNGSKSLAGARCCSLSTLEMIE